MNIAFHGLFGWLISTLCLIALLIGLCYVIAIFWEAFVKSHERLKGVKGTSGAKMTYVCEEVCGKRRAQELAKAMTDPSVTFEDFLKTYNDIKETGTGQ